MFTIVRERGYKRGWYFVILLCWWCCFYYYCYYYHHHHHHHLLYEGYLYIYSWDKPCP